MGLKIADLLKFKTSIDLTDTEGNLILDGKKPITVHIRLVGDQDLEESYTAARLESARLRAALRDTKSSDYRDRVLPISEATEEQCLEIIKSSRTSNLEAEARAAVVRPDLPKLEEFAVDADAPTLEEQERLDAEIEKIEVDYQAAIKEHVDVSEVTIMSEFEGKTLRELRDIAMEDVSNVLALAAFFNELMDQKVARGAYQDSTFREKAFESVAEFKTAHPHIKEQLIAKYLELEIEPQKIKN